MPSNDTPLKASAESPPDNGGLWLVSFHEDDDRELTVPQVAQALAQGTIDKDTIVWREGMAEWMPIEEVEELARLLPSSGHTKGVPTAVDGFLGTGLALKSRKSEPPPVPRRRLPTAPRRLPVPGRATPAEDEEPMSVDPESLASGALEPRRPRPPAPEARALSAGTFDLRGGTPTPAMSRADDDEPPSSGTPSLHALASVAPKGDRAALDELMGIGRAAESSEPLAPPTIDLSALQDSVGTDLPSASSPQTSSPSSSPAEQAARAKDVAPTKGPRSSKLLPLLLVAAAIAGAVYLIVRTPKAPPEPTTPPEPAALTEPKPIEPAAVDPVPSAPPVASSAPVEEAAPEEEVDESVPAVQPPRPAPTPREPAPAAAAPQPSPPSKQAAEPSKTPAKEPKKPAETEAKEVSLAPPFDKGAASAALAAVATRASSCRREGDPTGRATVRIAFANSGRATQALIQGPPFAGTQTGGCIASVMRSASVPAYSGARVTVSKTVVIH